MLEWFSVMKKEDRWAREDHTFANDCPEHLYSPILSICLTESAEFQPQSKTFEKYWILSGWRGGRTRKVRVQRAIICQLLASASQEDVTSRRGKVENLQIHVLKAPKRSWRAWNKPPLSSFLSLFFKLPSYLTLLGFVCIGTYPHCLFSIDNL